VSCDDAKRGGLDLLLLISKMEDRGLNEPRNMEDGKGDKTVSSLQLLERNATQRTF
jgi:hypothetical protein